MDKNLATAVNQGSVEALAAWFEVESKKPKTADILWCALWTEDDDIRRYLAELVLKKKIKPTKKGWQWNDAHAAAISGDPEKIAVAEKRGADFEELCAAGTPLTIAVRLGHVDFVRALLEKGVDNTTSVKMARFQKVNMFGGNIWMTESTPIGVALRIANPEMLDVFLEFQKLAPVNLGDAVEGGNLKVLKKVLELLGDDAPLEPGLFWSVKNPNVVPILADAGLDVTKLPEDTGTWGGPIWSWWAYHLRGESDVFVERFAELFATGVRGTAAGLAAVLEANAQGIATPEMVKLFVANGADLADKVSWQIDGWDDENDCELQAHGSVAERLLLEGKLEVIESLHASGAEIRPLRSDPMWYESDSKTAWLTELGLIRDVEPQEFPWVDAPSSDEIRKFLVTDNGIFGIRLGMSRKDFKGWDLDRVESGEDFSVEFGDGVDFVSREYRDVSSDVCLAMEEALTEKFGKSKGRGRRKKWKLDGGEVTLTEESNDYYYGIRIEMVID